MKYNPATFITSIKNYLYSNMPSESPESFTLKHKKRVGKMREIALHNNNVIPLANKGFFFELGNTIAEVQTPQYHILEDSEVIHKRGQGTKTSRGSQAKVIASKRDYGQWTKTTTVNKDTGEVRTHWSQEYRKNNRGSRSKIIKRNGLTTLVKNVSTVYPNVHYHYIENIINDNIDLIASVNGLKRTHTGFDDSKLEIAEQLMLNDKNE